VGLLLVSAPSFRKENKMAKDKVVTVDDNEVVIAEKVIDTKPKKKKITIDELSTDVAQLVDEVSDALEQIEKNFEEITEKVNKICVRLGISEL
tara:strand:- start:11902 stop:12180 length:279 start_codon:yes stop_codon:yes gene_type:complete